MFVVDPEHILKVLLLPRAVKFGHQSCGIVEGGPRPTFMLRWRSFRCRWWWNTWRQPGGQITLLTRRLHTSLLLYPLGWLTDLPPSPRSLVVGLPWSCELGPLAGAVFSAEGSNMTPLPVD